MKVQRLTKLQYDKITTHIFMLGDKLREALDKKNKDIKSFVWKGRKEEVNGMLMQKEQKLIDASESELKGYYEHCDSMLYNTDRDNPGRYPLLEIIKDQRAKCNIELFLRWLNVELDIARYKFMESMRGFLDKNRASIPDIGKCPIKVAVQGCPQEFEEIPIDSVLDGCLDKLGKFNKQHITLTFILKQGLWFTEADKKELTERDSKGAVKDRKQVVKERLGLDKPNISLYVTPKGLSWLQLRAMVGLKSKKYSELTTEQLETLRNRILFSLEDEVRYHINQWETRKEQIKQVCEYKGYTL